MKDGYIEKSVAGGEVKPGELEKINKLTRREFKKEEIYAFTVVLCDNDIDRDNERFTNEALHKLAELYVGKTGVLDHTPKTENQTARVFSCKVEEVSKKLNRIKQPYCRLVARAYMPRSKKNEDIILEIDSGIKKEVSVGCTVENIMCSICGKNLKTDSCPHVKGRRYKVGGKFEICHAVLDNPTDAYEWSFVAIPAQREAGVIKAFVPILDGGDLKMENIIKALETESELTLSTKQSKQLLTLIEQLEEKAEVGDFYQEELKSEVVKLSAMIQPEVGTSLMKSVAGKLSIKELKEFRDAFKQKLSGVIPAKPQFSTEKLENQINLSKNSQFKI